MTERDLFMNLRMEKTPTAPAQARAFLGKHSASWMDDMAISDALLVVSEVVSNALRYEPGDSIDLTIRISDDAFWVGVTQSRELKGPTSQRDEHSLTLIDVLSSSWGAFETSEGTLVWFEMARSNDDGQRSESDS